MKEALRDAALLARAAGDPGGAVRAWRAMLVEAPDDWRIALELKRDLKAGHHYPDSDPRFRRAARSLPDDAWLEHYAGLYAFHGSDLAAIDARAWALLARRPDEARLWAIRGDVARQRRDWPGAAKAFATALRLDPGLPEIAERAADARLYARLAAAAWSDGGLSYEIAVLNLDRNPERLTEIDRHFANSAAMRHRQPGIEGSRLSTAAVQRLTGDRDAPRGTLGCFLSHAAAWEALLASDAPCLLVIEDDVIPLLDLPDTLGSFGLPEGWELVFVNDRMTPRRNADAAHGFTATPLSTVMRRFHPEANAPGGDGYLITRGAAAKLLDWTARDGFAHDVDWRLLAYALSGPAIAAMPTHSLARRALDRLSAQIPRTGRLDAYVLHPALIRTVGVSSDREDVNRGE